MAWAAYRRSGARLINLGRAGYLEAQVEVQLAAVVVVVVVAGGGSVGASAGGGGDGGGGTGRRRGGRAVGAPPPVEHVDQVVAAGTGHLVRGRRHERRLVRGVARTRGNHAGPRRRCRRRRHG